MKHDWTIDLLTEFDTEISKLAQKHELDTFPNQIEIVRSDQMIDAYASTGLPLNYTHWSFGKNYVSVDKAYKQGQMGLAYELVINSNPCISYLMEENGLTMQALVIAHACYGHNSFFKGNYLFKTWTNPDSIIDYLLFAKNYISQCEEKYGVSKVEKLLDSCHALMNFGVDRYKRPAPISADEEKRRQEERNRYVEQNVNELWSTVPTKKKQIIEDNFPKEPQENLLYFIEKNAPLLETWEREIIRIVRKLSQYFYPQRQTKVMNEGWACFWHYKLLNELYDNGFVDDGFMMEFLQYHTSVIYQPAYDSPYYSGINPYVLGYSIFTDLYRICNNPTDEDREWFSFLAGKPWRPVLEEAMQNFKDESFILQYMSPKVMRDLKLFSIEDITAVPYFEVAAIHNESGYERVRNHLANMYNLSNQEPNIQITKVNFKTDRSIELKHIQKNAIPLEPRSRDKVLKHFYNLWQFPVRLIAIDDLKKKQTVYSYPEEEDLEDGDFNFHLPWGVNI